MIPGQPETRGFSSPLGTGASSAGEIKTDSKTEGFARGDDLEGGGGWEVVGHYDLLLHDVTMDYAGTFMCELVGLFNYSAELTVVGMCNCQNDLLLIINSNKTILKYVYFHVAFTAAYKPAFFLLFTIFELSKRKALSSRNNYRLQKHTELYLK